MITKPLIDCYKEFAREFQRIKMLLKILSEYGIPIIYINALDVSPSSADEIIGKMWEIALRTKVSTKCSGTHSVAEVHDGVLDLVEGYLMFVRYEV